MQSDIYFVKFIFLQREDLLIPVDENGRFTQMVADFKGQYVKDADKEIISAVKV